MRRTLSFLITLLCTVPSLAAVRGTVMTIEGAPIREARVEAYLPESGSAREERLASADPRRSAVATATTDGGGNFSLDVKKHPVVIVAVEGVGFEPYAIVAGGQDDLGAIALSAAPLVRGAITAGGKPVAGARLIFSTDDAEIVVISDAEGHYSVPDPAVWAPSVTIDHPDFATISERGGGRKPALNYQLSPGIIVAGRVVGEDNAPVSGARVSAGSRRAVTAADGTFTLKHLPEKRPAITVKTASLTGGDTKTERSVLIKMHRVASVSGVARDAKTQKALPGVRVATNQFEATDSVLTDANGAFTLPLRDTGRIRLWATYPNFSFAPVDVDVRAGQSASKNLVGTENATVLGTVTDEGKKAVPVARIAFAPTEDGPPTAMMRRMVRSQRPAYSAPDGRFVLRNIPPDQTGEILARRRGSPEGSAGPFKLASGEIKKGVGVVLPQGLTITGRVVDREGRPLAGVAVIPADPEDRSGGARRMVLGMRSVERDSNVETRKDGTFALQLREGRYDFAFRREGYATRRLRGITVNAAPQALEVTLEPGVEIRGRVVRSDGSGVPDVNINLMMGDGGGGDPIRTSGDGSFSIPNLSPGSLMLLAIKPEEFIREVRNVTAPADDLIIELPATGRIEGRVVDKESRRPVPQFAAGISQGTGNRAAVVIRMSPMMKNFNSEDGSFVIENVPAGKVQLVVTAAGFVDAQLSNLLIEEGKGLSGVVVELEPGVRVFGKVTGSDGTPLADASIRTDAIDSPSAQFSPDRAVTDGSGDYSLEGVGPGEKTIVFQKEGYVPDRRTVKLEGREVRLDVSLGRGKDIVGTVVDEQGMPVSGASVSARSGVQDAGFRTTRTDSSGAFRFEGLTPGRYTFSGSKSGYVTGEARDIDLDAAGAGIRITLTGGGTLFGHVSGLSEQDLGSAVVTISGSGRGTSGPVDSSGNYRIDGVPTGTVRVSASTRFPSQKTTPSKVAEVTAGSEVQVDLEFRSDVVIRGRVTRQGRPVQNAMIVFDPRDARTQTRASGRTEGNGSYEVSGLEPGNYGVAIVDLAGGSAYDTTYQVNGSDTFDIEMRGAMLTGRVTDSNSGVAVSDAVVTLQNAEARGRFAGTLEAMSDPSGNFSFETVSPGTYRIRAAKDRYGASMTDVSVSETDIRDIELKLARNDGIRLRVVDARDGRALRAFVWVRDQQGRTVFEGQPSPNTEGVIAVPVGPGSYNASVAAVGYAARNVNVVIPSQEIQIALSPGGTLLIQSTRDSREVGRLMTPSGQVYQRSPFSQRDLSLVPGTTTLENLAPGPYVLQLLDDRGNVKGSFSVTVHEGQIAQLQI